MPTAYTMGGLNSCWCCWLHVT